MGTNESKSATTGNTPDAAITSLSNLEARTRSTQPTVRCTTRTILVQESRLKGNTPLYDSFYRPAPPSTTTTTTSTPTAPAQQTQQQQQACKPSNANISPRTPERGSTGGAAVAPNSAEAKRKRTRKANNIDLFGEMMFGAIPMQIKSENTKIHYLPGDRQIMISKLFQVGIPRSWVHFNNPNNANKNKTESNSSDNNNNTDSNGTRRRSFSSTKPFDRPQTPDVAMKVSKSQSDLTSYAAEAKTAAANENENLYMCRSLFGLSIVFTFPPEETVLTPTSTDAQSVCSNESEVHHNSNMSDIQELFFSHFAIIELRMRRVLKTVTASLRLVLKRALEKERENLGSGMEWMFQQIFKANLPAYVLQQDADVREATEDFHAFIASFIKAPRIERPLWLSQVIYPEKRGQYFSRFLNAFIPLMNKFEYPLQKRFISSVVTAVLTHHLSWLHPYIVAEEDDETRRIQVGDTSTDDTDYNKSASEEGDHDDEDDFGLDSVSEALPDDDDGSDGEEQEEDECTIHAQQLLSLYGAGYINSMQKKRRKSRNNRDNKSGSLSRKSSFTRTPRQDNKKATAKKFCRVIVFGSDRHLINQLLLLLSYFVRCGEVIEKREFASFEPDGGSSDNIFTKYGNNTASYRSTTSTATVRPHNHVDSQQQQQQQQLPQSQTTTSTKSVALADTTVLSANNPDEVSPSIKITVDAPDNAGATQQAQGHHHDATQRLFDDGNHLHPNQNEDDDVLTVSSATEPSTITSVTSLTTTALNHTTRSDISVPARAPKTNVTVVPMLRSQYTEYTHACYKDKLTFGNTLFADVCTEYCGAFALMGLHTHEQFLGQAISDMYLYAQETFMGDTTGKPDIVSNVFVDVDKSVCNVLALDCRAGVEARKPQRLKFGPAHHISKMLHELRELKLLEFQDYACEGYFNDRLGELYAKSKIMANMLDRYEQDYIEQNALKFVTEHMEELARLCGIDISDIPITLSIASTQSTNACTIFHALSFIRSDSSSSNNSTTATAHHSSTATTTTTTTAAT